MSREVVKVPAPQVGDSVTGKGNEKIERVVAWWTGFNAWEVEVINDHGHRGKLITRTIQSAGFGNWRVMAER